MQDYRYCKIFLERNKLVVPKLFSLSCMCRTVAGVTCVVELEQFLTSQLESTNQAHFTHCHSLDKTPHP